KGKDTSPDELTLTCLLNSGAPNTAISSRSPTPMRRSEEDGAAGAGIPVAGLGAASAGVATAGACGIIGLLALVPARDAACGDPADCGHASSQPRPQTTRQRAKSLTNEISIGLTSIM